MDENNDGSLSFDEFLLLVNDGEVRTNYEMQKEELRAAFDRIDVNGDGQASYLIYISLTCPESVLTSGGT